jgi:hypothetical protein
MTIRRKFNKVGNPSLPENPTLPEIAVWLRDKAKWEELQEAGREMDAREWASTCLKCAADDIELAVTVEGKDK